MSLPSRLLGANPSIQVSTLLSGSLTTPSAKGTFTPPGSFNSIATTTLTSTATEIVFSSIPQTYQHLQLRLMMKYAGADNMKISFNSGGITVPHSYGFYSNGNGSLINLYDNTNGVISFNAGASSDDWAVGIYDITNYADTNYRKTVRALVGTPRNDTQGHGGIVSAYTASTTAISSIRLFLVDGASNFSVGSTYALYGIAGS